MSFFQTDSLTLASSSPRRLELLQKIHIAPQKVVSPEIDEKRLKKEGPRALAQRLALQKAQSVFEKEKENQCFILSADTVVACGQTILEKPEDAAQAREFLEKLSGRRHRVYGGISVISPDGRLVSRVCKTIVQFKHLSPAEIGAYLDSGEWEGKAGGYAIQGAAESFIKHLSGSYSNVVGLSLYDTVQMLKGLGFQTKG